jgi:hypothetical protein
MSKHCPTCNRIYDDSENFCQDDGAVLFSSSQSAETVFINPSVTNSQNQQMVAKPPNLHLIYGAVLLLSVLAVGFGVAYLSSQNKIEEAPKVNSNVAVKVDDKEISSPTITVEAVKGLLQKWEAAQDGQSFSAYRDCYTSPFKGIKTTPKGSNIYDYNGWMADRQEMLKNAVGLDVEIKNLQISIEGDTATVTFDQYYRSLRYSDWGPKELKIKQTPNGVKIVYENLKASYPL